MGISGVGGPAGSGPVGNDPGRPEADPMDVAQFKSRKESKNVPEDTEPKEKNFDEMTPEEQEEMVLETVVQTMKQQAEKLKDDEVFTLTPEDE